MGDHTAFFYGTLMAPAVLHRVIWGNTNPTSAQKASLKIRPAILHRFQRHKVLHADYPAILPANMTASVRGTLVEGLTDGDMWRLDIFEGDEYQRRKVQVRLLEEDPGNGMGQIGQKEEDNKEGEKVDAEVYVWIAGKQRLEPMEWDFEEFVREKMKRWVGREGDASGEYAGRPSIIEVDDAVATLGGESDPTGGRGANGNISKALEDHGKEKEIIESAV